MKKPEISVANVHPTRKKVLFVCMGNVCRSPMADSIARRAAADVIAACSAGLSPLGFLPELTTETLRTNGCAIEGLCSTPITREVWDAADVVINMSGIPKERAFRDHQKVEDWDVRDPYGEDTAVYQTIYEDIHRRVTRLAARLRNAVAHRVVK